MARAIAAAGLVVFLSFAGQAFSEDFRELERFAALQKLKLDAAGSNGSRLWVRLDSSSRPHRLYVSRAFYEADMKTKTEFVETFSKYLAGHPDKFMLIDIFDDATGKAVGEFGWGGFKLYPPAK